MGTSRPPTGRRLLVRSSARASSLPSSQPRRPRRRPRISTLYCGSLVNLTTKPQAAPRQQIRHRLGKQPGAPFALQAHSSPPLFHSRKSGGAGAGRPVCAQRR
eukprot:1350538-Pleurochrysis_carterae.AAC.1